MSDGPHRSLPMCPGWKRVAKRGDKSAFATSEIAAALIPALQQDCTAETNPVFLGGLVRLCRNHETSLFPETLPDQLEGLRGVSGSGLGRVILDEAVRSAANGDTGLNVAINAVHNALSNRAGRCALQVEEHYFRESTAPRAHHVRDRIEQAIGASEPDIRGLAHRVLNLENAPAVNRAVKQQGIDDGVSL